MAGKRPNSATPSKKTYYANYPTKSEKHRIRRVERHLKNQPNDAQAEAALKKGLGHRGAKKPVGRGLPMPYTYKDDKGNIKKEYRRVGKRMRPQQRKMLEIEAIAKRVANERAYLSKDKRMAAKGRMVEYEAKLQEMLKEQAKAKAKAKKHTKKKAA